jgi:hypothetical protein
MPVPMKLECRKFTLSRPKFGMATERFVIFIETNLAVLIAAS